MCDSPVNNHQEHAFYNLRVYPAGRAMLICCHCNNPAHIIYTWNWNESGEKVMHIRHPFYSDMVIVNPNNSDSDYVNICREYGFCLFPYPCTK
jgi:hypothetical protein